MLPAIPVLLLRMSYFTERCRFLFSCQKWRLMKYVMCGKTCIFCALVYMRGCVAKNQQVGRQASQHRLDWSFVGGAAYWPTAIYTIYMYLFIGPVPRPRPVYSYAVKVYAVAAEVFSQSRATLEEKARFLPPQGVLREQPSLLWAGKDVMRQSPSIFPNRLLQ